MRKQEAIELLDKLSHTKIDTWLLRSAKTLGSVKESKKERVRRAFMEQQAGINVEGNIKVVYEERAVPNPDDFEEAVGESMRGLTGEATQSEYTEELDKTRTRTKARQSRGADDVEEKTEQNSEFDPEEARKVLEEIHHISKHLLPTAVGTGLKRPLETDESGRPIIKKIKRASKIDAIPKFEFHNFEAEVSLGEDKSVSEAEQYSDEDVAGSQPEEEGSEEESEDASGNEDGEKVEKREEDSEEAEDSEEEEDSEEGEDSEDTIAPVGRLKRGKSERASAFKQWALQQRKLIDGEVTQSIEEGTSMPVMPTIPQNYIHKTPARDASPSTEPTGPSVERKAFYVTVDRPIEIQTSRLALPVVAEEQKIMEAIHNNPCVVVCGETGSGKTTQVPQFLFEAGYGNPESDTPGLIGVTQPRRVAAVSMAKRVGDELGVAGKDKVSYQVCEDNASSSRSYINNEYRFDSKPL